MIWLDFFLQAFVHALAWVSAVLVGVVILAAAAWLVGQIVIWWPDCPNLDGDE